MANKRVLDLAKDLGVTADDVQRAAMDVGVVVNGPTSSLDQDDVSKISSSLQSKGEKKPAAGSTTLTMPKPRSTGGARGRNEGGSHSVEISTRRSRRSRQTSVVGAAASPVTADMLVKPAERAQLAVQKAAEEKIAQQKITANRLRDNKRPLPTRPLPTSPARPTVSKTIVEEKETPAVVASNESLPKPKLSPARLAAEKMVAIKEKRSEEQEAMRQKRRIARPQQTINRPAAATAPAKKQDAERLPTRQASVAPAAREQRSAQPQRAGGPRTTIRTGLTPAQIAARKVPGSSVKQIEERISNDKRQQRIAKPGQRPQTPRSAAPNSVGAPRRTPSVAPMDPGEIAGAVKKRGPQVMRQQKRRLTPAEKAARRDYSSKRHQSLTPEQEERMARLAKGGSRARNQGITKDDEDFVVREVGITESIVVSDLAARMAVKSADLVKRLFEMGQMISVNETLDVDTAVLIVEEFGHRPKIINEAAVEDVLIADIEHDEDALVPRPPVVVVMGHVDHGKTSILDALRKASVADGEAGGITQHIGAYMVKLESNERVVFVDTPGHEAFTGLRARGANLTDVAVLVVAADDGVMPQTLEALNHARAADVPIIVAVNKMDKEGADPERVKRQLSEHGLLAEDWGGDTIFVNVSAHTGLGLDDLLEMLALQTEILELKANPKRTGRGVVIESRLDKGRGPVATVLVQNGTFKQGDTVVVGSVMGKIRAIVDENQKQHKTAGPSIPFELIGLSAVPEAGLEIVAVDNEKQARDIVSYRKEKERQQGIVSDKRASLDDLFANMQSGIAEVPVVIKGDVTGSVEAMAESMANLGTDQVAVKVVHKAIGGITESDIMLASAANAIVIGFNVRPEAKAKKLAEQEGVDIRFYKVIYDAIDEVKLAMAGKLSPDKVEKVTGMAEVREVFITPKVGAVAGSYITDGYVVRGSKVRVLRQGVMIYDGELASLRRFRDDVKEVKTGYECGIGVEKFNDIKEGDTFEFYIIEEVAATL